MTLTPSTMASQPPSSSTALIPSTDSASASPPANLTSPSAPTFPPAETFDFIPQTYDLLQRLLPPSSILPQPSGGVPGAGTLEPKDVDAEASRIRIKIQKARAVINELPDISRSIDEQSVEIKELEEKIRKQKELLGRIRELKAVKDAVRDGLGKKAGADEMVA